MENEEEHKIYLMFMFWITVGCVGGIIAKQCLTVIYKKYKKPEYVYESFGPTKSLWSWSKLKYDVNVMFEICFFYVFFVLLIAVKCACVIHLFVKAELVYQRLELHWRYGNMMEYVFHKVKNSNCEKDLENWIGVILYIYTLVR